MLHNQLVRLGQKIEMSSSAIISGSSPAELPNNDIAKDSAAPAIIDSSVKDVRIWMDGAFDMMHFGHMNAFRLGKALGMIFFDPCADSSLNSNNAILTSFLNITAPVQHFILNFS